MKITTVRYSQVTGEIEYRGQFHLTNEDRLGMPYDIYPEYKHLPPSSSGFEPTDRKNVYQVRRSLLEIHTDEGISGLITKAGGAEHLRSMAKFLLGKDPLNTEFLWDLLYRSQLTAMPTAAQPLAAIDIALWDLKCKALGVPLHLLLGGKTRSEVPAYAMARDYSKEPDDVAKTVKELAAEGFVGVKYYPRWGPTDGQEGEEKTMALVRAIRQAVGDDFEIMLDIWKVWDVPYTIKMAQKLEPYRIRWIEEPVFQYQFEQYVQIRQAVNIPISGGEQLYCAWQFKQLFDAGAVDIAQPDPFWCGGITETMRVIHMAQSYDIPVVMHVCHVPLNVQISAVFADPVIPIMEYPTYQGQLLDQFFLKNKVLAVNGKVPVPDTPAIFELDESVIVKKEVIFEEKL